MRVRSMSRVVGYTSLGAVAGLAGVAVSLDSSRLEKGLRSLGRKYPFIDGFNPVPLALLIAGPVAGFGLALRRNRQEA